MVVRSLNKNCCRRDENGLKATGILWHCESISNMSVNNKHFYFSGLRVLSFGGYKKK
jgi:hypothetical protein